jgi:nucleoside phosphorylase
MGPENSAESLKNTKLPDGIRCVILAGFAGALQSAMSPGDLALDLHGADANLVESAREAATSLKLAVHFGRILTSERIIATAQEKAALGLKQRACAVEMEAASVSAWAARRRVPFYHLRTILDTVDEAIPADLPQGEDLFSMAAYAASHPSSLPALIKLGIRQKRAMRGLSLFVGRFLEAL